MATQLKHTDFTYTPTRPNVRVAFIAGEATAAVQEKIAPLPYADLTLEEFSFPATLGVSLEMTALIRAADEAETAYNTYYYATTKPLEACYFASKGTPAEPVAKREHDASTEKFQRLVDTCSKAQDAVCNHPVTTAADLRAKLAFMAHHQMGDGMDWTDELLADASRLAEQEPDLLADKALLDAYADRRRVFEQQPQLEKATPQEDDVYFARIDASEDVLLNTNATTVEGVLAKLRVAFLNQVGEGWSDLATSDPAQPAFVDGLRMSDMHNRMAWSAIEDLARIGGVNLAEQGR